MFVFVLVFLLSLVDVRANQEVCVSQKGHFLDLEPSHGGRVGLCQFGISEISSDTLANELSGIRTLAVKAFFKATTPFNINKMESTAVRCEKAGGKYSILSSHSETPANHHGQYGVCTFSDGSMIDAGTLYRGSVDETNQGLLQLLKTKR